MTTCRTILIVASVLHWGALEPGAAEPAAALRSAAARQDRLLREKILPYWYDTAVDWPRGGYLLADDAVRGRYTPDEKQLVTQSRMIWTFSLVHRRGFSTPERNYLKAATQGVRFLRDNFRDRANGGYFFTTDLEGRPRFTGKILYAQAFVLYALVEYHRASGEAAALDDARQLYREIHTHAHDPAHGGWIEHFQADWTPILEPSPEAIVELGGCKSANTHLHLMEALAEFYDVTRDRAARRSLEEALRVNQRHFYPRDAARSAFHRHRDWSAVTEPASAGVSYGHNVEFAWLMIRAEDVLGRRPSWRHFQNHLAHTLRNGTDHARGGVYNKGLGDEPATDTSKVWWVQAEMLAALTDGLRHRPGDAAYQDALVKLLEFTDRHQADPRDGIWLDTVAADGQPKATGKAHNWKANYHDVRALLKFVDAFGPAAVGPAQR